MPSRDFLSVAREVARGTTSAHWRTATGRAYYALMLELRDAMTGWGLTQPPPAHVHRLVHLRVYASSDADMKQIGQLLDVLKDARGRADYETAPLAEFANDAGALLAIQQAAGALSLFDRIQADAPRRTAIATEIRAVLP